MNVDSFSIDPIDSKEQVDYYLKELFSDPRHRNMHEVQLRSDRYINDKEIKEYFISKAAEELKITPLTWHFDTKNDNFKKDYREWKKAIRLYDEALESENIDFEKMIPLVDDLDKKHKSFMSHKKARYK